MKQKHFLSILDFTSKEIFHLLQSALAFKKEPIEDRFSRKLLVSLYEKQSLRTRLSFERAMSDLGGAYTYYSMQDVGLGVRESIKDVARVCSRMCDIVCLRVYSHADTVEFASHSSIPVINALSDREHPCQALADILTILELRAGGDIEKLSLLKVAYLGDCNNNVTHSLALICGMLGIDFVCAAPKSYTMAHMVLEKARALASVNSSLMFQTNNPNKAVEGADVVYTDTWVSMGCENERDMRVKALKPYRVTSSLMSRAKETALFMHDMPAYRGFEVDSDVIDGKQSVIYDQAENRLHAQKALLAYLLA